MATPPLTLYRTNNTYSFVPHSVLLHFNIPFTAVPMRPTSDNVATGSRWAAADGSLTHEQYLAINPTGFVPALTIGSGPGSTVITEMPGVLTYLASQAPDAKLLGDRPLEQAKVAEWMAWLSGTVHALGFVAYLRMGRFVDEASVFDVVKRRGKEVIEKSFATIDEKLKGREFAVGEGLTVVDFNLYPFWRWASKHGFELGGYPNYAAHLRKVEALEGVKKALEAEGLKPCFGYPLL